MDRRVNDGQLAVLRWVGEGCPEGVEPSESYKGSALALANRRLIAISKKGGRWQASLTEAGRHFLEAGEYPESHFLAEKPAPASPVMSRPAAKQPAGEGSKPVPRSPVSGRQHSTESKVPEVDSPARVRQRGSTPRGDGLRKQDRDPWDERVLVSVKEAAWLLSMSEGMIRQAASDGDVERVFIGAGTTHYRIVYGSLLAWVNSMAREPATRSWWY